MNVHAGCCTLLSSYATMVESMPPLRKTPICLLPIAHILTESCIFDLNSSKSHVLSALGHIVILLSLVSAFVSMLYSSVSPGSSFLMLVKKVFLVTLTPDKLKQLRAILSTVLLFGTRSNMPFISEPNTIPSDISA